MRTTETILPPAMLRAPRMRRETILPPAMLRAPRMRRETIEIEVQDLEPVPAHEVEYETERCPPPVPLREILRNIARKRAAAGTRY